MLGSGFWLLLHEMVGDIGDGAARLQEYAELQTDPYGATVMWTFDATAGELVDDPVRAARAARKALERDPKGTFTFFGATAAMHLGWALAELGEPEEGLASSTSTSRGTSRWASVRSSRSTSRRAAIASLRAERLETRSGTSARPRRCCATRRSTGPDRRCSWPAARSSTGPRRRRHGLGDARRSGGGRHRGGLAPPRGPADALARRLGVTP